MTSRASALWRTVAGAIVGIIPGVVVALLLLVWLDVAVEGPQGGVLGFVGAFYALPIGALVGGTIGALVASRGHLGRLSLVSGGMTAAAFATLLVVGGGTVPSHGAAVQGSLSDSLGCRNDVRNEFLVGDYLVVSFDRSCTGSAKPTINVSVLRSAQAGGGASGPPSGEGNVLVLERPDSLASAAALTAPIVSPSGERRMAVHYDARAHVLSQHSAVGAMMFEFVADTTVTGH